MAFSILTRGLRELTTTVGSSRQSLAQARSQEAARKAMNSALVWRRAVLPITCPLETSRAACTRSLSRVSTCASSSEIRKLNLSVELLEGREIAQRRKPLQILLDFLKLRRGDP